MKLRESILVFTKVHYLFKEIDHVTYDSPAYRPSGNKLYINNLAIAFKDGNEMNVVVRGLSDNNYSNMEYILEEMLYGHFPELREWALKEMISYIKYRNIVKVIIPTYKRRSNELIDI